MAHKARRRPSWKKPNRWKYSKYVRHLQRDLATQLAIEIRREIAKEMLEEILKGQLAQLDRASVYETEG